MRDTRGLVGNPDVSVGGDTVVLKPGRGNEGGSGFFAFIDASGLADGNLVAAYRYTLRGSQRVSMLPDAGSTRWTVRSSWPHPSFAGDFLPQAREVNGDGFSATYEIGNLALGRTLLSTGATQADLNAVADMRERVAAGLSGCRTDFPDRAREFVDVRRSPER